MVPSLDGPEGFLGLRGARGPAVTAAPEGPPAGALPACWGGSCLRREPGEGAPELQGEQKGIMVARMRARQSATSLLGAQARAGVRPGERGTDRERESDRQKEGQTAKGRETDGKRGRQTGVGGRKMQKEYKEGGGGQTGDEAAFY